MEIQKIEVCRVVLKRREPFRIALGTSTESENIVVKVRTDKGGVGWGEASPFEKVTNENPETVLKVLDDVAPKLVGTNPLRIEQAIEIMDESVEGNPSAKAAVDIALHDIIGKTARQPLFMLMGGYRKEVLTDITLGIKSPEEMAKDAVKAVKQGFEVLKVKVGINPREDVERIRRVREAVGSKIALRIDANQGWTVQQAMRVLPQMEEFNIQFVEQPVKAKDIKGLAKVRRNSGIPVMADESVHSPEDATRVIQDEAVDLINIKLMKSGGILKARKIAAIAESNKTPCMIGCMGESMIGIAAGVQLAAAVKNIQYADLDSDLFFKHSLVERGGPQLRASKRIPSWKSGLGIIRLNEKLLGKPVKTYC